MTNDKLPDNAFDALIDHLARYGVRFIWCMERDDIESAHKIAETVGWAPLAFALARSPRRFSKPTTVPT